jgi:hypothetical protein
MKSTYLGTALYFKDHKLKYSGLYSDGEYFRSMEPTQILEFD